MNSSERLSRVMRGSAAWQPLRMSALGSANANPGQAGPDRGSDSHARIAAAFSDGVAHGRYLASTEADERDKQIGEAAGQRLNAILEAFAQSIEEIESNAADRVLDLAAQLAATIACRDILQAHRRIEPVLGESLKLIAGACRQLDIVAHPQDCPAIEAWLKSRSGRVHATIRPDAGVTPGGCRLRADDATLDATLQTRIRRTLAAVGIDDIQAREVAAGAVADAWAAIGRSADEPAAPEQPPHGPAA